jgi:hypothetical protein
VASLSVYQIYYYDNKPSFKGCLRGAKPIKHLLSGASKRDEAPLLKLFPFPSRGFVSKVVIPVKTGIQIDIIRHEFWIPTCVGMTEKLKNGTYNTSPPRGEGD